MLAHAAAFAYAKPGYFTCALLRTTGLAARIGRARASAFADRALAEPWKAGFCGNWTVLTDKFFFFANCAPKIYPA